MTEEESDTTATVAEGTIAPGAAPDTTESITLMEEASATSTEGIAAADFLSLIFAG